MEKKMERAAGRVDFLGIGATRAGTTWLWSMLKENAGIWMPPIKELHYFDRASEYPSPSLLAEADPLKRFFGKEGQHALYRRQAWRTVGRALLVPTHWQDLPWLGRYLTGVVNDDWYLSLFAGPRKACQGEITPAYSLLTKADVAHVRELLPDVKLVYLLRNPVERAWSGMRFRWEKGRLNLDDLPAVMRALESPAQVGRSDYVQTLKNWWASFAVEQLLVCFYDEIGQAPRQLLEKVFTFLGVDPGESVAAEKMSRRVNAAQERAMPAEVRAFLARKYLPEVEALVPLVGGYTEDWLKELRASVK